MFEDEYADESAIPAAVRHLFIPSGEGDNAKFVLIPVANLKTVDDVARVQESLRKERNDHKATRTSLTAFGDLDPTETRAQLARIPELEIASKGKLNDDEINTIVESRLTARLAPVQNELKVAKTDLEASQKEIGAFKAADTTRKITGNLKEAGAKLKMRESALADLPLFASQFEIQEGTGLVVTTDKTETPGVSPEVFLMGMQDSRPHWWPDPQGGGLNGNQGGGANGKNPFSEEHWNMTEQGVLLKANRAKAEQLAKAAGTTIGGGKPPAKK